VYTLDLVLSIPWVLVCLPTELENIQTSPTRQDEMRRTAKILQERRNTKIIYIDDKLVSIIVRYKNRPALGPRRPSPQSAGCLVRSSFPFSPFSTLLRSVCGKHVHHDHDASTDTRPSWLPVRTAHCHSQNVEGSLELATTANLANAGAMEKSLVHTAPSIGRCAHTMHPILVEDRINSLPLPQSRRVHSRRAQGDFLVGGRKA
jgi:hypothetical protein